MPLHLVKAQAYGNDFLYADRATGGDRDWAATARATCDRHAGIGADGLIVYDRLPDGARMSLFNADGSVAEVSGNGVRGLAALLCWLEMRQGRASRPAWQIETGAGPTRLELLAADHPAYAFRAAMTPPTGLTQTTLDAGGERVDVVILRVGNPQCVVLVPELDEVQYRRLGPLLECHPAFPQRTNVSFARVAAPDRVEVLIWERGVGPTSSSGTGSLGAAAAAMTCGGCARDVDVAAPGGVQRVAWTSNGMFLTGWVRLTWEGEWLE